MKKCRLIGMVTCSLAIAAITMACGKSGNTENTNMAVEETATEPLAENEASVEEVKEIEDIKIVYTNDVHSYISNVVKDEEGNITGDGLRFSKVAAMVTDMKEAGENVLLVDAGDEVQGDIYGAMDEGQNIIDIMNATGYQLATPGNHDFDYGMFQFFNNVDNAEFNYVSCNFHSIESKEIVLPASQTFEIGGQKVTFIGITTPDTITSSTPAYFQNEAGEFIYTIDGCEKAEDMYVSVQNAIDNAREKSDYVIALGHVGVGMEAKAKAISSEDVIANTSGLDAFIDGHSHTTNEGSLVKDKDGNDVLLTQSGYYLNAIGVMTISKDGSISTELVNEYDREDEAVAALENSWIQTVSDKLGEKIATLDTTLYIYNPDDSNQRLIRSREMNSGDFTADSVYWFFNDRLEIECDIAIQNGGGVRAQLDSGDLTYMSAKQIEPFGNMICLIKASGQQILDALELGVTDIGEWNDEWNCPAENGAFLHVAGMTYNIDPTIESSVETDANGMFVSVKGDYRVRDVKVYNKETGEYEPLDLNKEYQVAGINYILRNGGNGMSMFDGDELSVDYVGQDYVILAEYMKSFEMDGDYPRVNTKNSPLSKYDGYLINYEEALGSERIRILD